MTLLRLLFTIRFRKVYDVNCLDFLCVGIKLTLQELIRSDSFIKLPLTHVALAHGPGVDAIAKQVFSLHVKSRIPQLVFEKWPISKELDFSYLWFLLFFLGELIFTFNYWTQHFRECFHRLPVLLYKVSFAIILLRSVVYFYFHLLRLFNFVLRFIGLRPSSRLDLKTAAFENLT